MKANKFWSLLMMLVMALAMVSCGSDDDEKKDDNGGDDGGTTVTTEYTATTEVKEIKLKELLWSNAFCIVYADFKYKYILNLSKGSLYLDSYYRNEGSWKYDFYYGSSRYNLSYIKDVGKVNSVGDILEKNNLFDPKLGSVALPQHGYAMAFKTEDDEWKYLRVYIKGYTLDDKEALSSITVQYQLY